MLFSFICQGGFAVFSFSYGYQLFIKFCPDDAGSKDDESISYWYSYYLFCVLNLRLYNTDKSTRLLHFVEQETFNHWITPDVWAPAPAKSHCCTQIAYCVHHIENWICRFPVWKTVFESLPWLIRWMYMHLLKPEARNPSISYLIFLFSLEWKYGYGCLVGKKQALWRHHLRIEIF